MPNKKKLAIVIILLSMVIISFLVGQSFAKYISKVEGTGIGDVAKWNFQVNGSSEEIKSIKLIDTCDVKTLADGKIAPGTSGSFEFIVDALDSEVGMEYNIEFLNETNKPKNLTFLYNGKIYNSLNDVAKDLSGIINANADNKIQNYLIDWQWDYETGTNETEINLNDDQDTLDGNNISNYTFDVKVTSTQLNPNN